MFVGRVQEIDELKTEFALRRPSLVTVWGRRRIGKSRLLQEAAKGCPSVYFQATRDLPQANLDYFKEAVIQTLGDDGIIAHLPDWFSALNHLANVAQRLPGLVVVLDEFPYLCEEYKPLPSYIQKLVDSGVMRAGNLKLVLCGSTVASMSELLAEKNPLFGRHTGVYRIGPMPLREAAGFFPDYSSTDAVATYGVFGGVPYFLESCDPDRPLSDNIIGTLLSRRGILLDEPVNMLKSETEGSARYFGILHAIADGCVKSSEIKNRVGSDIDGNTLSWYLNRLRELDIIQVTKSMDATSRERDRRYAISDPLTAFWFRFVQPNMSAIGRGSGKSVFESKIVPAFSEYMGDAFENICRDHVRNFSGEIFGSPAGDVGKIWSSDYDIDVMGELLDGSFVFGECKWTNHKIGDAVFDNLTASAEKVENFGKDGGVRRFVLFSKSGFTESLVERVSHDPLVRLVSPDDLMGITEILDVAPSVSM